MRFIQSSLEGVIIQEPSVFEDSVSHLFVSYDHNLFLGMGIEQTFRQETCSRSVQNTIIGLQYQLKYPQSKLVLVTAGSVFDVAVDLRRGSPTFGHWTSLELSRDNMRQLYIPEGYAHGYCVLSQTADIILKLSRPFSVEDDRGILWSDPSLGISWPVSNPILSYRAASNPKLADIPEELLPVFELKSNREKSVVSCFLSHSTKDKQFADKFYDDLRRNGVRCWYAPEDMRVGDKIRSRIDESIRVHNKLLLVLSENSVISQWVEQEVETALRMEREQMRRILFPIRLDESVMNINDGWPALIRNTRHIGDFREWKNHNSYQNALNRFLRDLTVDELKQGSN